MTDKYIDVGYRDRPGGVSPVTVARPVVLEGVTATSATPGVFTKADHGLVDDDVVIASGFTEMTEVNGETFIVNQVNSSTFQLANNTGIVDTSGFDAETTGGTISKVDIDLVSPTNEIRVYYDDTFERDRIVDAVQRAKEALTEIL